MEKKCDVLEDPDRDGGGEGRKVKLKLIFQFFWH